MAETGGEMGREPGETRKTQSVGLWGFPGAQGDNTKACKGTAR
eukprot:CAMPEP_0177609996 /NCGR_PEP_ID=MMETSP0419_2-20121207/19483_1 /TAXON_ID=582737 /ORGANISM="Tetraselmis sp., Strain GSL018" /LENGTH=42 /DNA_ID= /DNA_START= /DNA_END= /DNA_ORIENTATION=